MVMASPRCGGVRLGLTRRGASIEPAFEQWAAASPQTPLCGAPAKRPIRCRVSRVSPVQTAVRNCTRDEGGPFGFGDQVADPKPPRAAAVKSRGGERRGNVGTMIPAGKVQRGERKQTASEASKAD